MQFIEKLTLIYAAIATTLFILFLFMPNKSVGLFIVRVWSHAINWLYGTIMVVYVLFIH